MAVKYKRRSLWFWGLSEQKEFWPMGSRLTAENSGFAISARRPMCGRGGVARVVGTTSPRVCKANTSRRCTRRVEHGTLVRLRRAGEKNGGLRVSKKRSRCCVHKLSCSVSSKERKSVRRSRATRREEAVAWTKAAGWRSRRRCRVKRSWMSKGGICKDARHR